MRVRTYIFGYKYPFSCLFVLTLANAIVQRGLRCAFTIHVCEWKKIKQFSKDRALWLRVRRSQFHHFLETNRDPRRSFSFLKHRKCHSNTVSKEIKQRFFNSGLEIHSEWRVCNFVNQEQREDTRIMREKKRFCALKKEINARPSWKIACFVDKKNLL